MASRISSLVAYFPVPTMRREVNSLLPRVRFVSYMSLLPLAPRRPWRRSAAAAPHGADDLHAIAVRELGRGIRALGRDVAVDGHRRVLPRHPQLVEQGLHAESVAHVHALAVDRDPHRVSVCQRGSCPRGMIPRFPRKRKTAAAWGAAVILAIHRVPFAGITQSRFEGSRAAPGLRSPPPTAWPVYTYTASAMAWT